MRISNSRLSLLFGLLLLSTCVCLTSCKNDGFKNGCLQFIDKEMERYAISKWDTDHNNCLDRKEVDSANAEERSGRLRVPKSICEDGYSIKTLDDLAHFPHISTIGFRAFRNCKSLETAHLPTIWSIWSEAFLGCSNLREIEFPKVREIGDAAFANCTSLTSVNFPNAQKVGFSAFYGATQVVEIRLPNVWKIPNLKDYYEYSENAKDHESYRSYVQSYYLSNSPVLEKLILSSPQAMGCQDAGVSNDNNCNILINPLKGDLSKQVTLILNESQKSNVSFENGVPYGWARTFWKSIQFVGNDAVPPEIKPNN